MSKISPLTSIKAEGAICKELYALIVVNIWNLITIPMIALI